MNIGFVGVRFAGVDGVSLETAKLARAFTEMDHAVFYCAGEFDDSYAADTIRHVPEMHFTHPTARALHDEAFSTAQPSPDLFRRIYASADHLRGELERFVNQYDIDLIVPQNASAIPMHIALGVAIGDLVRRTRIRTLCHHHDFYWERPRFISHGIQDILDENFPPRLEPVTHMVISTVMQQRLYAWRGLRSFYLPNVFDFENPPPPPDDYANTFRAELGLSDDDLIVLQPTRLVRRKVIEKAIELMRQLADPRLILLITGYEGDEAGDYGGWLRDEADRAGIRYRFIGDYIGAGRGERDGHKVFDLWDVYPHAHFVTYPSNYEGFGNALIETLYFRKPFVVHTYPVYVADIRSVGVQAVEFHDDITPEVVASVRRLIDDAALRERMVEHNYAVGLQHFSHAVLRATLSRALTAVTDD